MADETWTVDRFEGDHVVLETARGEARRWPRDLIPTSAREGDVLVVERERSANRSQLTLELRPQATKERKAENQKARDALAKDDDGGDVKL